MNKSIITNGIALLLVVAGYFIENQALLTVGLFALSGAVTNWLAIHMLFEKVPGLYGSGVIPARFEDFKLGIKHLMMSQFFTRENIDRFMQNSDKISDFHLAPVIEKLDMSPAFDALVKTILESSFGSMLGMFGGVDALTPLKEPFLESMKASLIEITSEEGFQALLMEEIDQPDVMSEIKQQIESIVEQRLNELTPQLVKEIIQEMIKKHLGWLVVWGGVFGGLIGFAAAILVR
ncbi:FIG01058172: hypothetical protein [hydrothermal vent metagenome]|uniref:DUF445 domain-containing protein n=1 Tax=hydrothermal vent metagenome TaxID=652676 RepID=A0A3B0XYQ6_9ZZZZ